MLKPGLLSGIVAMVLLIPASAAADITAFLGVATKPETRQARGLALGMSILVIGLEFEYSDVTEDIDELSPGLRTGSLNALLQTPVPVAGMQLYLTGGGGLYRERLGDISETNVAGNVGGGAKIRLAGPLRLRLDYRVFSLRGSPLNDTQQRFYAGINLGF
jgi:hypothetical protein